MHSHSIYDDAFDAFDGLGPELQLDAYEADGDGELAAIVGAFDPVFEPELLIEYLRVWAASARTHASDLFDDVVAIDTESVACLEVQRLTERRVERRVQVPGDADVPDEEYDGPIERVTLESAADLVPRTIEACKRGSVKPVACSCRNGTVECKTCHGTGRAAATSDAAPGGCVVCGTTGRVAHEVCKGAGFLKEYVHGTIVREVDTSCTMSGGSPGMARAKDVDWWESDVDPGRVLAMLPHDASAPLKAAWDQDPPGTAARYGILSALPIYKVTFRRHGRERHAWLIGAQLRVVVPGSVGRTQGWMLKKSLAVTMTVVSLLVGWARWSDTGQPTTPVTTTKTELVDQGEPTAPPAPAPDDVKRVEIPPELPK